jgi:hypothetical protein
MEEEARPTIPSELGLVLAHPHSPLYRELSLFLRDVLGHLPPSEPAAQALYSMAKTIHFSAPEMAAFRLQETAAILNRDLAPGDAFVASAWQGLVQRLAAADAGGSSAAS